MLLLGSIGAGMVLIEDRPGHLKKKQARTGRAPLLVPGEGMNATCCCKQERREKLAYRCLLGRRKEMHAVQH